MYIHQIVCHNSVCTCKRYVQYDVMSHVYVCVYIHVHIVTCMYVIHHLLTATLANWQELRPPKTAMPKFDADNLDLHHEPMQLYNLCSEIILQGKKQHVRKGCCRS